MNKRSQKIFCSLCDNASVNNRLSEENDLSYHAVGETEKDFRIMIAAGGGKPIRILFERWMGKQWNLVGIYEPSFCPNCGRPIHEYEAKRKEHRRK